MSKPGGYSLNQLLEWCKNDRLIDGYDYMDESVAIMYEGTWRELSFSEATQFLKGVFTSTQRRSGRGLGDDDNRA